MREAVMIIKFVAISNYLSSGSLSTRQVGGYDHDWGSVGKILKIAGDT